MDPVEALENAVRHHAAEMPPTLIARHRALTLLRQGGSAIAAIGVFSGGLLIGDELWFTGRPLVAAAVAALAVWLAGGLAIRVAGRATRHAIARSTLRSFEALQHLGALGAGGSSAGVTALLTPAQQMALKTAHQAARKQRASRVHPPDRAAPDFDDSED